MLQQRQIMISKSEFIFHHSVEQEEGPEEGEILDDSDEIVQPDKSIPFITKLPPVQIDEIDVIIKAAAIAWSMDKQRRLGKGKI